MKKIDWYIVKKFLGTFFFAILILAVIACVIDLAEKMDDFVSKKAPVSAILNYYKDFVPHISALLFPLFIFIATIFFTSKMAYQSEVITILASGVSFQRFLKPYVIGATFLGVLSLITNHWIVPNANKQRLAFEDRYVHNVTQSTNGGVHLRLSKDLFVYMREYRFVDNYGQSFSAEKIEGTLLKEKLVADHISYDSIKKTWHLYNVIVRTNNDIHETIRFLNDTIIKYPFAPGDMKINDDSKDAMTTPELITYIDRETLRGRENLNIYMVEKHRRTAQPVAGFILTIIGVCIAHKKIRGGSGLHLALGIVICALFEMLMQFSTTFSTKAGLNPFIAAWIPNLVFGYVAYYLYRRQIK